MCVRENIFELSVNQDTDANKLFTKQMREAPKLKRNESTTLRHHTLILSQTHTYTLGVTSGTNQHITSLQ